ncbi:MAG: glycerol-3-phosphate cytidylyltransferase, partial [Ruminococcus flavefaciens]|nr:glycerol-3-phosphate cytidylyltransferase [Ruminococcus flavefaciens]
QDAFLEWGGILLLPIIKILGIAYKESHFYYQEKNGNMTFTRGILEYDDALASFKVGKGIKFEGTLVITGENGYIFVPAPWWKMNYFEIRYEDLRKTKKYFFDYEGEGIRYEIQKFVEKINYRDMEMKYSITEILCETDIVQQYCQYKKYM